MTKAKVIFSYLNGSMLVKLSPDLRAQAMEPLGKLLSVEREGIQIHVLIARSQGATSSLAIASLILTTIKVVFQGNLTIRFFRCERLFS